MEKTVTKVKIFLVVLCVLAAGVLVEFARERWEYKRYSSHLQEASKHVEEKQDQAVIVALLGPPDHSIASEADGQTFIWSSSYHQGELMEVAGLTTVKGHFQIVIALDSRGHVERIWQGTN